MLFKESVTKLGTWMRQNERTDPELAYWVEKYLLFRGTRSFTSLIAEDTFASTNVRVAAVGQDLIGWTKFLHGKVSVEIASIQRVHCMMSPSCQLTGEDWMKAFISHLIQPRIKRIEISPKEFTSPLLHKTHPSNVHLNLPTWPQKTAVPPLSP